MEQCTFYRKHFGNLSNSKLRYQMLHKSQRLYGILQYDEMCKAKRQWQQ